MTFSEETREAIKYAQNEVCKVPGCYEKIDDYHHCLENTKPNRKLFPLFIHSIFNCVGIHRGHHDGPEKEQFKISVKLAEVYERWLERFLEKGV